MGRPWPCPVLLRGAADADWSGLPLVCGIAVAAALDRLAGERAGMPFRIKWPNDIICAGRKMCGILCESSPGGNRPFRGGGHRRQSDSDGGGFPGGGIAPRRVGADADRNLLIPGGNGGGHPQRAGGPLGSLRPGGFASLRGPYEERCITLGREVRLLSPDGGFLAAGRAAGLAEDGGLIVDTAAAGRFIGPGRCRCGEYMIMYRYRRPSKAGGVFRRSGVRAGRQPAGTVGLCCQF